LPSCTKAQLQLFSSRSQFWGGCVIFEFFKQTQALSFQTKCSLVNSSVKAPHFGLNEFILFSWARSTMQEVKESRYGVKTRRFSSFDENSGSLSKKETDLRQILFLFESN